MARTSGTQFRNGKHAEGDVIIRSCSSDRREEYHVVQKLENTGTRIGAGTAGHLLPSGTLLKQYWWKRVCSFDNFHFKWDHVIANKQAEDSSETALK